MKCKTLKLLQDNTGENLGKVGFGDECLVTTLKAWSMKKICAFYQLDFIKINNFVSVKDTVEWMKRQLRIGRIFDKELLFKTSNSTMRKQIT